VSVTNPDRWTCPACARTVVVYAGDEDTRVAIAAMQTRHAQAHREAAQVLARLGMANPLRPARRKGRAA
jgi:hypothetical protein